LVGRFRVSGGEQVEQQAPGDGDAQPQVRARPRLRDPAGRRGGDEWFEPVDSPAEELIEEPSGMRVALQGLAVELEEQALVRPQRGGREELPPRAHNLAERLTWVRRETAKLLALAAVDGARDLNPEPFLGAEVEDQHPVAGAQRGSEGAQAQVADPVLRRVLDRRVEELLPRSIATHTH
jgi:hypothetical protein